MNIKLLACFAVVAYGSLDAMILPEPQLGYGYSGRQGPRPTMEDVEVAVYPFGNNHTGFFAVYDGHGGVESAKFVGNTLHKHLRENLNTRPEVSRNSLFVNTYLKTESEIRKQKIPAGTTAITALIENNQLHLAWAGDSRAIVIRGTDIKEATIDHKPERADEKARIEERGGKVIYVEVVWRVNGNLAMSRSLGDTFAKEETPGAIIATPEYKNVTLQDNDIIVLACDGLWDVFKNEEVVKLVNKLLKETIANLKNRYPHDKPAGELAAEGGNNERLTLLSRALRDEAIIKRSHDNVSVMVIQYKSQHPMQQLPIAKPAPQIPAVAPVAKAKIILQNIRADNVRNEGISVMIYRNENRIFGPLTLDNSGNTTVNFSMEKNDSLQVWGNGIAFKYTPSGNTPRVNLYIDGATKAVRIAPAE